MFILIRYKEKGLFSADETALYFILPPRFMSEAARTAYWSFSFKTRK